jgi:hypothetical protein
MESWPEILRHTVDEIVRISGDRGVIAFERFNAAWPQSMELSIDQIEELLQALNDKGILIVEG